MQRLNRECRWLTALTMFCCLAGGRPILGAQTSASVAGLSDSLRVLCPRGQIPTSKALLTEERTTATIMAGLSGPMAGYWRTLGCIRVWLSLVGTPGPKDQVSVGMAKGRPWIEGAVRAFLAALEDEPNDALSLQLLRHSGPLLPQPLSLELAGDLADAFHAGALGAPTKRELFAACVGYGSLAQQQTKVLHCLSLAHDSGGDSALVWRASAHLRETKVGTDSVRIRPTFVRLWNPSGRPVLLLGLAVTVNDLRPAFDTITHRVAGSRGSTGLGSTISLARDVLEFVPRPVPVRVGLTQWVPSTKEYLADEMGLAVTVPPGVASVPGHRGAVQPIETAAYLMATSSFEMATWTATLIQDGAPVRGTANSTGERLLDESGLSLSDLVIGSDSFSLTIPWGASRLRFAPQGVLKLQHPVHLAWQTSSVHQRDSIKARIALYPLDPPAPSATISLEFEVVVPPGIALVQRELDLSKLSPGRYRVEMTLTDVGASLSRSRSQIVRFIR